MEHGFETKRMKVEKLSAINLLIVNSFLTANIPEINETLLLPMLEEKSENSSEIFSSSFSTKKSTSKSATSASLLSDQKYLHIL